MMRNISFAIFLFVASPLVAQEIQGDPISETLKAAKTAYEKEIAEASELLVESIDARISHVENNSRLSVKSQLESLKELKAERDAFLKDPDKLPSERSLLSSTKKYKRQLRYARTAMEKAFNRAADDYRKPPVKDFEAAARVLEEQKTFFASANSKLEEKGNAKLTFEPAFTNANWIASAPNFVKIKKDQLLIAAVPDGNVVLTKKNDFHHAHAVVELAAAKGTEAFVILNAQKRGDRWSGVTSRIYFDKGKVLAGGQRTGFRKNAGAEQEFEVGDYFKLRLHVHDGSVVSWLNGQNTARIGYGETKTNTTGSIGFVVRKGALSIKSFKGISKQHKPKSAK